MFDECYGRTIVVLVEPNAHKAVEWINVRYPSQADPCRVETFQGAFAKTLVWINNANPVDRVEIMWFKRLTLPALAHELHHLVCNVFALVGITHHDSSEEAFCYYAEMIARGVGKHFKRIEAH